MVFRKNNLFLFTFLSISLLLLYSLALIMPKTGVIADTEDVTPPTLVSLTYTDDTFNTTPGVDFDGSVTVVVEATDDITGVEWISIRYVPVSGYDLYNDINLYTDNLTGGTLTNGTFTGSPNTEFSEYAANGEWMIETLSLTDALGNTVSYNETELEGLLSAASNRFVEDNEYSID